MINALILKIHENKKKLRKTLDFFSSGGKPASKKPVRQPHCVQRVRRGRVRISTFSDTTQHQRDVIIELCNNLQERSVSVTTQGPRPGRVKNKKSKMIYKYIFSIQARNLFPLHSAAECQKG